MTDLWFEHAGTRLYALEQGQGAPIVYLHGGLADHRGAVYRLAPLAATHRLITPDQRGAGRSVFGGELSWELLADDLAALLDHLGLERAVVGGSSGGSATALAFALRHPERVQALVLVWPLYPGSAHGLPQAAQVAMDRMDDHGRRAVAEGIEAVIPLYAALPEPMRSGAIATARTFDPASIAATTRFLASGAQPMTRTEELAALEMPVLVVPGIDPEHPAEIALGYARVISRCTVGDSTANLADVVRAFVIGAGGR
jgi:pimeloyl-ACP methyl ester carboxylesterase